MVKREYACAERHSSGAEDTMIASRSDVQTDADGREEESVKKGRELKTNRQKLSVIIVISLHIAEYDNHKLSFDDRALFKITG